MSRLGGIIKVRASVSRFGGIINVIVECVKSWRTRNYMVRVECVKTWSNDIIRVKCVKGWVKTIQVRIKLSELFNLT